LMEEAELCDSLVILDQGQVVAQGSPEALRAEFGHDVIELRVAGSTDELETARRALIRLLPEGTKVSLRGDTLLRLEVMRGFSVLPALESHFGARLKALQWGRPTLEDVFL